MPGIDVGIGVHTPVEFCVPLAMLNGLRSVPGIQVLPAGNRFPVHVAWSASKWANTGKYKDHWYRYIFHSITR